jgi:hypothetical protein
VFWRRLLSPRLRGDHLAWLSGDRAAIAQFAVLYVLARPTWGTDRLGAGSVLLGGWHSSRCGGPWR